MEFPFNINNLLGDDVSIVDSQLAPFKRVGNVPDYRDQLLRVLDRMGEASAKAQGLRGPITGGRKLEFSDHHLYVMKDAEANSGNGAVVGILKMGPKKLFVYDHNGIQHEMQPLCVLDFYVHESRQRTGCGKKLFEHMLQNEQVKPQHLAIDRPSAKFSGFLGKHYNLKATVKQVNNFVIFDGFFRDRPADTGKRRGSGKPPLHPYRKPAKNKRRSRRCEGQRNVLTNENRRPFSADRPPSGRESSLSGSNVPLSDLEKEKETLKNVELPRSSSREGISGVNHAAKSDISLLENADRSGSLGMLNFGGLTVNPERAMGAGASMYSRHVRVDSPLARPDSNSGNVSLPASPARTNPLKTHRGFSPPLLSRAPPPADYLGVTLNQHRGYQGHGGHLRVSPAQTGRLPPEPVGGATDSLPNSATQKAQPSSWNVLGVPIQPTPSPSGKPRTLDSSWNVMGVPPQHASPSSAKKWQPSRLW